MYPNIFLGGILTPNGNQNAGTEFREQMGRKQAPLSPIFLRI